MKRRSSTIAGLVSVVSAFVFVVGCVTADTVGWRTDWTGKYLSANPITQWSPEENVLWKTELPATGNSTPIPVGDKLLLTTERTRLMCVRASDGEILWQRTNNFVDMVDEEKAEQIKAEHKQAAELRHKIGQTSHQIRKVKQAMQDKPDDEDLKTQLKNLQQKRNTLNEKLGPYNEAWYSLPPKHQVNGYASATPVSDGEHVYAAFGTGLVTCYDLDGNMIWRKVVEKPPHAYGFSASPLLVGDRLMVSIENLIALDKATGDELWKANTGWAWGSPIATTIGETDVVITAGGHFVRAADGKILAHPVDKLDYCTPVVEGDVVYFIEHGGNAVRLPDQLSSDSIEPQVLWTTKPRKDRYYASPVVHDGLIYACTRNSMFSLIDAETGEILYEKKLDLGKGNIFPSVTMAGDFVYISSENGTTLVLRPGRTYDQVAVNKFEQFRGSPVFVGDRLFIHGLKNLYCLGSQAQ